MRATLMLCGLLATAAFAAPTKLFELTDPKTVTAQQRQLTGQAAPARLVVARELLLPRLERVDRLTQLNRQQKGDEVRFQFQREGESTPVNLTVYENPKRDYIHRMVVEAQQMNVNEKDPLFDTFIDLVPLAVSYCFNVADGPLANTDDWSGNLMNALVVGSLKKGEWQYTYSDKLIDVRASIKQRGSKRELMLDVAPRVAPAPLAWTQYCSLSKPWKVQVFKQ